MRYFLRVRQAPTIAAAIVLAAALLIPSGTRHLPLPDLGGMNSLGMPLALFVPVMIALALAYGLSAGDPWLEAMAVRPLPVIDALFGGVVALVALGVYAFTWIAFGNAWSVFPLGAGRNALGYIGLALLGRALVGPRPAGLFPVVVVIASAVIGSHADGTPRWWAWPIADASDRLSWIAAALTLALGSAATAFGCSRSFGD